MSFMGDEIEQNRKAVAETREIWEQVKLVAGVSAENAESLLEIANLALKNPKSQKDLVKTVAVKVQKQIESLEKLESDIKKAYTDYAAALLTETAIVRESIPVNKALMKTESSRSTNLIIKVSTIKNNLESALMHSASEFTDIIAENCAKHYY